MTFKYYVFILDKKIMKKRQIVFLCLFVIVLTGRFHLNAQVSIGGSVPQAPKPFSILELISVPTVNVGGLRLPQLNEDDKAAINVELLANAEDSKGLFIYNTDKSCIEYWDGTKWVAPGSSNSDVELPWQISGSSDFRSSISPSENIYHIGSVTIGDNADADPTAILNVQASNRGVLLPRVTLTGATDRTTIPDPTTGLLVYNTGANPSFPTVGYMFWDGSTWRIFANASAEPATATLNCEGAAMNPSQQVLGGTALTTGTLLQIPYQMSNGGNFSGITLSSTDNPDVKATIAAGTLAMGSGVLSFSLTGTPTIAQQAPTGIKFDLSPFLAANPNITGCSSGVTVGNILSASIQSTAVMGNLMLTTDNTSYDDPSGPAYGASSYQMVCNSPDGKFSFRVNVPGDVSNIAFGTQSINVQLRNNQNVSSPVIWNASVQWGSSSDYGGAGVLTVPPKRWGGQNADRGSSWTDYTTNSATNRWGNIGIYDATTQGPEYRRYTWIPLGAENKICYQVTVMAALDTTTPATAVVPTLLKVYIKFEEVVAK